MRNVAPDPGLAVAEHIAAGLLDDAIDHRQAEAGALADLLGGEERLENLVAHVGGNAVAVVLDLDQHVIGGDQRLLVEGGAFGGRRHCGCAGRCWPPSAIASRALTTRLTITCSNWLRSALTSHRSRPCTTSSSIVSPTSRRSSICNSDSTSPSCSVCGRSVWRREKASNCRTSPAARLAFCLICMMSWKDGSVGAVIGRAADRNSR